MLRAIRPADGLRFGICTLAAVVAVVAVATDPADARSRRKRHHAQHARVAYSPPYAAIVVDANSGSVLHNTSADSLRRPASLTKIMTLYLLFEQLEAGKLRLDTRLEVSEHASQQAPSKLGLRPGQTISVEEAIRALVTKSANDAAVVVAEALGGDEETFARMMTRKARALGMSRTVYANASGLPDEDQLTTARDQATLGRAIQDRFPRQYRYFATPAFVFHGRAMRNHNKLLGRVEGRHQDRLHACLGLQSRFIGTPQPSAHRRGGHGRCIRRCARRAHAHVDRAANRERFDAAHCSQDRGSDRGRGPPGQSAGPAGSTAADRAGALRAGGRHGTDRDRAGY